MKASGIILIEVLIGTAIAAIVSTLLIGAWYQTNRFSLAVDESVLLYTRASMLAYQLERDISGAFVPELDMQQIEKQPTKEPLAPKTEQEKKPKPLEKIFYGENSEGQLKLLTFITNNPLQVYWGPSGKPKIRIARVVYTLEPNKEEKGSYILYRQEGQELDFKAYKEGAKKTVRRYELVRGIKHMTVEYTIIEEQKDKEKPKEPAKREYKEFKKWEDERGEKDTEKKRPLIPNQVKIQVLFWDTLGKKETSFTFIYPIIVHQKEEKSVPQAKTPERVTMVKKQTTFRFDRSLVTG